MDNNNNNTLPILIFYHGGGFFFGSVEQYESYLIELSIRLHMLVISVE